jgi:hypothetical protein
MYCSKEVYAMDDVQTEEAAPAEDWRARSARDKAAVLAKMSILELRFEFEYVPQQALCFDDLKRVWKYVLYKGARKVCDGTYTAGIAHAPSYTRGRITLDIATAVRKECATGMKQVSKSKHEPLLPDVTDVMGCLVSDGSAIDHPTYESWARDLGYDEDSRKGEKIYRACVETGLALRALLGEVELQRLGELCSEL